jgi:spore maturation protein CgeB
MSKSVRILFVGESWQGSSARSLREAIAACPDNVVDDINEDLFRPAGRSVVLRASNRLMSAAYRKELAKSIISQIRLTRPDALVVYKGNLVDDCLVAAVQQLGVKTVNIFPDCSPHAHGRRLQRAIGKYDLVISTKPYHPEHWSSIYGYRNKCVFVPHGYDRSMHFWSTPPQEDSIDLLLAASWRPQYEATLLDVSRAIGEDHISVALAGSGWRERRHLFPSHWQFPGSLYGRAYGEFVRKGKIVISPVQTDMRIRGQRQPGDEDSTRTYELAAAGVFFLHRRTEYIHQVYADRREVILWDDSAELIDEIRRYLPLQSERRAIALAAHRRAVPAYSIESRAREVMQHISSVSGT